MKESSDVIVLRPEVSQAFPNEESVNNALLSLIDIAQKITRHASSTGSLKKTGFPINFASSAALRPNAYRKVFH